MSGKSKNNSSNRSNEKDLIEKLFSAGFTIFGIGFPILAGALAALNNPTISTTYAKGVEYLVNLLLPAILICAAQLFFCLGTLTGFFNKPRWAIYLTFALLLYMTLSILIVSIYTLYW